MRRVTPTIWTYAGPDIDLARPSVAAFQKLAVIGRSLANQARYLGHTFRRYSVAEHSFHAWALSPYQYARHALLHDVHEAITGDIPAPWKAVVTDFQSHEEAWMCAAAAAYKIEWTEAARTAVEVIDQALLATELRDLMEINDAEVAAELGVAPLPVCLKFLSAGPDGWASVWEYHVRQPQSCSPPMHAVYVMGRVAQSFTESRLEIRRRIVEAFKKASIPLDELQPALAGGI